MHGPVERWPAVGNVKHGNGSVIPSGFCYFLPRYRYIARTIRTRHMDFTRYIVLTIHMGHTNSTNCKINMVYTDGIVCNRHMVCLNYFDTGRHARKLLYLSVFVDGSDSILRLLAWMSLPVPMQRCNHKRHLWRRLLVRKTTSLIQQPPSLQISKNS